MLEIQVREASPSDADAISAVVDSAIATLRETYRPKAAAHQQVSDENPTRLVAVSNEKVVGTLEYRLKPDGRLHFTLLAVHSDFRRQGVAAQLLAALERIGKTAGAHRLSAYTVKETGNLTIFDQLGFRVISEEPTELFESDLYESLTEAYLERPIESTPSGV